MAQKNTAEYMRVEAGFLEIRQKLSAGHLSTSGKSHVVVSTGGFKPADGPGEVRVNLTAITK